MDRDRVEGLEHLLGRIRQLRALERELEPFTRDWYATIQKEAELIDALKQRLGVMDVEAIEWIVAQQ